MLIAFGEHCACRVHISLVLYICFAWQLREGAHVAVVTAPPTFPVFVYENSTWLGALFMVELRLQ